MYQSKNTMEIKQAIHIKDLIYIHCRIKLFYTSIQ